MADVIAYRGGTADFKGYHCAGDWPEFRPPLDSPHFQWTPPFNSHACGAKNQGWLNLDFPLCPNLGKTYAHRWQQEMLKLVTAVNDTIWVRWVPTRAFLDGIYVEVTNTDPQLDGLYIMPVAARVAYDFDTESFTGPTAITEFDDELTAAGVTQLPLGTPQAGDNMFAFARLSINPAVRPSTFGISLPRPKDSMPIEQFNSITNDPSYGHVMLGYRIVADPNDVAKLLHRANFAVYLSAKLNAFECAMQTG